jgi:hypothetical protein
MNVGCRSRWWSWSIPCFQSLHHARYSSNSSIDLPPHLYTKIWYSVLLREPPFLPPTCTIRYRILVPGIANMVGYLCKLKMLLNLQRCLILLGMNCRTRCILCWNWLQAWFQWVWEWLHIRWSGFVLADRWRLVPRNSDTDHYVASVSPMWMENIHTCEL